MADPTMEREWLAYSRRLLTDGQHLRECAAVGGSPPHPGVDAVDLRWPGYLGSQYERDGLLVVANVHRDFASGGFGKDAAERLVAATRLWRDERIEPQQYLDSVRAAYSTGLRAWTVGSRVGQVLAGMDATVEEIAYTNAARCQFPELPPKVPRAGSIKRALVKCCVARFPISDLVSMLRPRAVLFTSVDAYDASHRGIAESGAVAVGFHQWFGNLTRPLQLDATRFEARVPLREWVPALRAALLR